MTGSDRPRIALVTGGAVRLGRAISLGLARAGYDLVISYNSSGDEAHDLAREVSSLGRTLVPVQADLGVTGSVERVIDTVRSSFGQLDVMVNSAASFQALPLLEVDE